MVLIRILVFSSCDVIINNNMRIHFSFNWCSNRIISGIGCFWVNIDYLSITF